MTDFAAQPIVPDDVADLAVDAAIGRLREWVDSCWLQDPNADLVLGIQRGGVRIAEQVHRQLQAAGRIHTPLSTLDINLYRDDFDQKGHLHGLPNHLPENVEGRRILMIDDVLFTGRSTRAAINILFDYGRPAAVSLAVLIDRGGRELPISADFAALAIDLSIQQRVKLSREAPFSMALINEPAPHRDR